MNNEVKIERTPWWQDSNPRAWCPECQWRTSATSIQKVNRQVNAHVRKHDHRVQVYRSQWKAVETEARADRRREIVKATL